MNLMKTLHTQLTRRMLCFAMTIAMTLAVSFAHGQTPVARNGQLRVIDESGKDYLYPQGFFVEVDLPEGIRRRVLQAA